MGLLCCLKSDIELILFVIGAFYVIRWLYRIARTIQQIKFGTKVTVERYGPKGSWAVVTGSTDGIGKAFAMELASRGFNLVLISRNIDKLNATAKELQAKGQANGHNVQTRVLVFDFCEDTSLEAYNALYEKISTLDISVLVNNVGMGDPVNRNTQQVYREIAVNCYPIVLLTQQLVGKFEERFTKQQNRSIIINLASQAALMPAPFFKNYAATKVFDDYFSKGLFYELRAKGVDVLSVKPGMVATPMTRRKEDKYQMIITADECAKGALDKATAFETYGGNLHEIMGVTIKCLVVDLLPSTIALKITAMACKKFVEQQSKLFKKD